MRSKLYCDVAEYDDETNEIVILSDSGKDLVRIRMSNYDPELSCASCSLEGSCRQIILTNDGRTSLGDACINLEGRVAENENPWRLIKLFQGKAIKKSGR